MGEWTREAGVVTTGKLGPLVLTGIGVGLLTGLTVRLATLPDLNPAALVIYPFMAVWITLMARLAAIGVYTGPAGVRIRRLLRTHTVEWSRVGMFISAPGMILGGEGPRHAIWLHLTDGERIQTPIHRRIPGLAVSAYRHDITLSPDRYDQVLAGLRARLTPAA